MTAEPTPPTPPTLRQAAEELRANRRIVLPGGPSTRAKTLKGMMTFLLGLICFVVVGGVIAVIIAIINGFSVTGGLIFGVLGVCVMGAMMFAMVFFMRRRQDHYATSEHEPVVISAAGITCRGIGPIPWQHFGLAQYKMVQSSANAHFYRRAVLPLTPPGIEVVNHRLPLAAQRKLGPRSTLLAGRQIRSIFVPTVVGLTIPEVMELINWAHQWLGARS